MKILLIDDHKLFALSIQMILSQSKEIKIVDVISETKDLSKLDTTKYDILLIDINLTNISEETGLELSERLIQQNKDITIVILTGHLKLLYEERANKIGTKGFIDKNIAPEELIQILQGINSGERYFINIKIDDDMVEKLSKQEVKILSLARTGNTIEDIADELYISKRTVFNHLSNIYSKLYVNNKQEAVYKAEQLGYFFDF